MYQNVVDLNVTCRAKRTKTYWHVCKFKCQLKITQPSCPGSRDWRTGKGLKMLGLQKEKGFLLLVLRYGYRWFPYRLTKFKLILSLYHSISSSRIRKRPTLCTDCTTPLFYMLAPTCFGSSLPSSGSLLDSPELIEIQLGDTIHGTMTIWHTGHVTTRYMICHPSDLYFK
jgi:hypothetical protein